MIIYPIQITVLKRARDLASEEKTIILLPCLSIQDVLSCPDKMIKDVVKNFEERIHMFASESDTWEIHLIISILYRCTVRGCMEFMFHVTFVIARQRIARRFV